MCQAPARRVSDASTIDSSDPSDTHQDSVGDAGGASSKTRGRTEQKYFINQPFFTYQAAEDETPLQIANAYGVNIGQLLAMNKRYAGIRQLSKLQEGTSTSVSELLCLGHAYV